MGCDQCHNHPSKLSIMWHIICAHAPTITAAGLMMIVWLYLLTLILYGMWLANPEVAKHREWQFVSGQIIGGKNEQGKISWSHQRHLFCYQKGSSLNRRVAITFPNSINISVLRLMYSTLQKPISFLQSLDLSEKGEGLKTPFIDWNIIFCGWNIIFWIEIKSSLTQ